MTEERVQGDLFDPAWDYRVTSFRGLAFGATHYYGILERDAYRPIGDGSAYLYTQRVTLHREMTAQQARELLERDGGDIAWRDTTRFDDTESLDRAARGAFALIAADTDWLVKDKIYVTDDPPMVGEPDPSREVNFQRTVMGAGSPADIHIDTILCLDGNTMLLDSWHAQQKDAGEVWA